MPFGKSEVDMSIQIVCPLATPLQETTSHHPASGTWRLDVDIAEHIIHPASGTWRLDVDMAEQVGTRQRFRVLVIQRDAPVTCNANNYQLIINR